MPAINILESKLIDLKRNRQKKSDDLTFHEKCVRTGQADLNKLSKEIEEYESAITLLKEELQRTVEKHRSKPEKGHIANKQKCVEEDPYVPKFSGPRV